MCVLNGRWLLIMDDLTERHQFCGTFQRGAMTTKTVPVIKRRILIDYSLFF